MLETEVIASDGRSLSDDQVVEALHKGLEGRFARQSVLVLIPDHTRSLPLARLFSLLVEIIHDASQLDFMVSLGTHPPLSEDGLNKLLGMTAEERKTKYSNIGVYNHAWDDPACLVRIGSIEQDQIREIAGEHWHSSLPKRTEVHVNAAALEHDHVVILGPTFPHEVAGFSGGAKYLFPGISGPAMINTTHWLGALTGVAATIGVKRTPVREMIHAAAADLPIPVTLVALVGQDTALSGLFIGDYTVAWNAAADLSARRHVRWCDKPFRRALSCAPAMYNELWTAAKAMYKLEPVMATGGEVIIYAPHLDRISDVHGKHICDIGYHVLPYFLENWGRFEYLPLGVVAHCTHLRGAGVMEGGVEKPNLRVTLASRISADVCARLNLGYLDPAGIDIAEWKDREDEGILYVPRAGETLYRLNDSRADVKQGEARP